MGAANDEPKEGNMSPMTIKTDEKIKVDVVDELHWDTRVDASDTKVRVDNGVVTLTGKVPTFGTRTAASEDAWSISGVRQVENRLEVELPEVHPTPRDEEVRSTAESLLAWNPDIDSSNVDIDVEAGIVTLTGTTPTHWEKTRAEDLVTGLRGVLGVRNELAVVPSRSFTDETIAEDIVQAMDRNLLVDPSQVDVTVTDGIVSLHGDVPSVAARTAAYQAASRTPGVVDVDNELSLQL
jgi:osmotically-inducible protein OsmY